MSCCGLPNLSETEVFIGQAELLCFCLEAPQKAGLKLTGLAMKHGCLTFHNDSFFMKQSMVQNWIIYYNVHIIKLVK